MTTWITDIAAFFSEASTTIAAIRTSLSLPALNPSGAILVGQEYLSYEHAAPRIVAVPISHQYEGALPTNSQATGTGTPPNKYVFSRHMRFDVHIWGNPDPANLDDLYSFNSTIELEREFLYAMQASATIPTAKPSTGEWRQPQDVAKYGRLLVLQLDIWTPVVAPPYTVLPYSKTVGDGGVAQDVTVQINPPTGGTVGPIVIPS